MSTAAEPVIRWTPEEAWLMAELARRALIATLDGGAPVRAGSGDDFRVEIEGGAHEVVLVVRLDAGRATLALAPARPAGHRWREAWTLEIGRAGEPPQVLTAGAPAIELDEPRRGPLRAALRMQRRALVRGLDGVDEEVPLTDVAFHRYTRQSTALPAETSPLWPWASPTEPELAPWWELDLGRAMYVARIRIDLVAPPPGARVVVRGYGTVMPSGLPPSGSVLHECAAEALAIDDGHAWLVIERGVVARYLRVELIAAACEAATLAVTAAEVVAAGLFAGSLADSMRRAFALHRDRPLFVAPRAGEEAPVRYGEVWSRAMGLGRGLARRFELTGGEDRIVVGVMTRNRPEWVIADLAALARGYVVVAIAPDDADDRLAHILARARPGCVICEPAGAERVSRLAEGVPPLLVVCDDDGAAPGRVGLEALIAEGASAAVPPAMLRSADDLYAVLFTSGSTGTPKGAMRTYGTFHTMLASYGIGHAARHLSFQPLSHLSEFMYLPALLLYGSTIAFSRGGAHLLDELRGFEPTVVGSVPRLFEVLHAGHQRRLRAALAAEPEAPRGAIEARVFADSKQSLGGRLLAVSVGSAPVSAEVLAFMRRCFTDVWVSEGYGSTEVGSIAFDGKVADHVEVKLVRGEIWVRTPHAICGYLGDPEATAAAIDGDGFFATGDLGERDADGRVRVIGRIGNTVKLAQGEFVSAERIETALAAAPIVDRVYVHVQSGAPGVAALVVPAADALARALDLPSAPVAELIAHPGATAAVLAAVRAHARATGLASYEVPRAVLVEAGPLTVGDGTLTVSGKLARGALSTRFGARLAALAAGDAMPAVEPAPLADDDLLARVTRVASRVAGRAIDPREPLGTGVGVDSLAAAEILASLSDDLGREVPLAWWFEARTLEELAVRLGRFAPGDGVAASAELATADLARPVAAVIAPAAARAIETVLLTGATGFLGAHLVEALRARGLAVVALVRAADDQAATARLAAALDRWRIPVAVGEGVRAIAGDLAAPDLGIDAGARLDGIDAIVHAGATVSWLASYPALRASNVLGTLALIELAAARGLPLHHVSTISTAPATGDEDSGLSLEEALRSTPYGLSKWIAEALVRRAGDAGLPVAVYRPAMIAGHTRRGVGNPDDFLHRYLGGCADLGLYIDRDDAVIDMTPVDYVAAAIVALVVARPRGGDTFHLANVEQSLTFAGLGRAVAAAGVVVAPAPYAEFRAALGRARSSRLHPLMAFFPERFGLGMGPWPCARTVTALTALGIERPRIDDAAIARYVAALGLT